MERKIRFGFWFVGLVTFVWSVPSISAREVALTIDDAPRGADWLYTADERARKIIEVLRLHAVKTVFFTNSDRLSQNGGLARMKGYAEAGHAIANHTHTHPNANQIPVESFLTDLDKADRLLRPLPGFVPWFRFPYLKEGTTTDYRDRVRAHLAALGYRNGYVTVDNYDYFVNDLVQTAIDRGKKVNPDRACQMLIDLTEDGLAFYDRVATQYLGQVRQVLLMHENDLEAYCLDRMIRHLRVRGWRIVSPAFAFADPLLQVEPETLYLAQGRVAAAVHVRTGRRIIGSWENATALRAEFKKRQIVR